MKTRFLISQVYAESGKAFISVVAATKEKAVSYLRRQFNIESLAAERSGLKKPVDCTEYGFFFAEKKIGDKVYEMKWDIEEIPMI